MNTVKVIGFAVLLVLHLAACDTTPTPADVVLRDAQLQTDVFQSSGGERYVYSPVRSSDILLVVDLTLSVSNTGDTPITAKIPNTSFVIRDAHDHNMAAEGILDAQGTGLVNGNFDFDLPVAVGDTASADYQVIFLFPKESANDPLTLQYAGGEPIPFTLSRAFTAETPQMIAVPFCEEQFGLGNMDPGGTYLCIEGDPNDWPSNGQHIVMQPPEDQLNSGCNYIDNGFCITTGPWTVAFEPPVGNWLASGLYEDAQRIPFQEAGHPGMTVSSSGGCNELEGRFEVRELLADPFTGDIMRFAVVFEQTCDGNSDGLRGMVRWVKE